MAYYQEELGQEARRGKYITGTFSEYLIQASAKKLQRFFYKQHESMQHLVIVPIPSNRHPQLVPQFAQSLANMLNVQFANVLAKKPNELEQKSLLNGTQQEKNIRDSLYLNSSIELYNKHILLIDDFVDSKWTFTIAAELLGNTYQNIKVTPFAIADTSGAD
ncbi:hypothetical protein [Lysinibacillus endophyticus]|uniref:hypothetical protein n=1 Tax=Ureibacillus endophyticus TaxID=1978490 RepID=UPI0031357AE8